MAVQAAVAVPTAHMVASFVAPVEESLVTIVTSAVMAQDPEPDVAQRELPVVQVELSLSADGTVTRRHPRCVR